MIIKRDWTSFKSYLVSKGEYPQMFEFADKYELFYAGGGLTFQCIIFKENPNSTDQLDFENNFKLNCNKPNSIVQSPFAAKILQNGKKLYKREHGIQFTLITGTNIILFTIPYAWVKIIGVEVMYGEKLDTIDLIILDSVFGTYSGTPSLQLNQFGYSVNVSIDEYEEENAYDADLYQGMQIKIVYNSQSAKTIGINFNLNEVKA
jgi:hypothetical protein